MPNVHITSADPLGLASAGVIDLESITPSTPRSFVEMLLASGKYSASAVKAIKPLDQFDIVYNLMDTASLTVAFGVAVNTNFLITSFSCSSGPEKYPQVKLTAIKPSNAAMIKAYASAISLTAVGGFGIVNKWGATAAAAMISSECSISMQNLDAMDETSGDFMTAGIYRFGFKQECQVEAYGAITMPTHHGAPNAPTTPKQSAAGWQSYMASWWKYMDPAA